MRWTWPCYVDCLGRSGMSLTRWTRDLPEEMVSDRWQVAFFGGLANAGERRRHGFRSFRWTGSGTCLFDRRVGWGGSSWKLAAAMKWILVTSVPSGEARGFGGASVERRSRSASSCLADSEGIAQVQLASVASAEASSADRADAVSSDSRTILGEVCIEPGNCRGVGDRSVEADRLRA